MDKLNIISLHFNMPDKFIYIYNFYNLMNIEKISINILILNYKLAVYSYEEYIILSNFKYHHKVWKRLKVFKTLIKK